ncbi:acetyl-CoA carboxylase biotin carboxyl carrier protein subunit [Longibacter salinarum]|uniref:Acetyl-CoA carboxylase biotin carboxyl carrier protein subunit n=1 Tax=Longibacter salinarum TaxID=1850348 RepID=A0A2A8CY72_9BACT|nr:biotin/lipoyl-containing protein [Longibacter salinarum]PEN13596.1 acetyl-CoA carboxylase biotin carboxyl carrier protein subunit [Longibacter salinarum]
MSSRTYQALVGDRSVDVTIEDGQLLVNGEPRECSFRTIRKGYVSLILDGRSVPVSVEPTDDGSYRVTIRGRRTSVRVKDERALLMEEFGLEEDGAAGGEVRAPMPGLVLDVLVSVGATVEADQGILVLEAMKMENELKAPSAGTVSAIHAGAGDAVEKNALLIEIEAATE